MKKNQTFHERYRYGSNGARTQMCIRDSAGAVISQVGDLSAAAIKRNHDIKDYGKIIPGHGGIMDRFDSVLFTAPAALISATRCV